jgi:hypothetical protein
MPGSDELLTVTVPGDGATGPITLRVGAEVVTSAEGFIVT